MDVGHLVGDVRRLALSLAVVAACSVIGGCGLVWYLDTHTVRQTLPNGDSPEVLMRYPARLMHGHALQLCREPTSSFDKEGYEDCLHKLGLMSPTDWMLWSIRGGWKPLYKF